MYEVPVDYGVRAVDILTVEEVLGILVSLLGQKSSIWVRKEAVFALHTSCARSLQDIEQANAKRRAAFQEAFVNFARRVDITVPD